jgi:hypothetical protein
MMAISKSRRHHLELAVTLLLLACPSPAFAQESPPPSQTVSNRFHRLFVETRLLWRQQTNSATVAWQFARACFDWADVASRDSDRADVATQGIEASRRAIELESNCAPAYCYLGRNLGQLAQTRSVGAIKLIDQMAAAWIKVIELDEKFDYAGAHRSIGLLYLDAPGWPTSLGSKTKARHHLQKAVELCPDYPANRLALLKALLKWGDTKTANAQLAEVGEVLQAARSRFTGEEWAYKWEDWDYSWLRIRTRLSALQSSP